MPDVLVLCYHAVSERWPAPLSVTPDALERQVGLLVGRGYRGATMVEVARGDVAGPTLAVTFDDAYRSVLELGLPILRRLGVPASVFVPTDYPDRPGPMSWPGIDGWVGGPHEPELTCLSWSQLGELAEAGWEVGSHTASHPRLTTLEDDRLAEELEASRTACRERLGRPCESIAYPYGDVDDRVVAATGRAGYRAGAALPARPHRPEPLRWPRVGVWHTDGDRRFRLKASRAARAVWASPLAGLAYRAGRALR